MLGNVSLQASFDETDGVDTANGLNIVGVGTDNDVSDRIINAVNVGDVFADTVQVDPDNNAATANSFTAGLLANNGGATQTIALASSILNPALNAGLNNAPLGVSPLMRLPPASTLMAIAIRPTSSTRLMISASINGATGLIAYEGVAWISARLSYKTTHPYSLRPPPMSTCLRTRLRSERSRQRIRILAIR